MEIGVSFALLSCRLSQKLMIARPNICIRAEADPVRHAARKLAGTLRSNPLVAHGYSKVNVALPNFDEAPNRAADIEINILSRIFGTQINLIIVDN